MRIKALKTIIALDEHNCDFSIHKLLGIPRSTMWAHIDEIERETGLVLIKRQKQNTSMTEDGKAFVPYAKKICDSLEEGLTQIKEPQKSIGIGEIYIATTEAVCASWLMPSIKEFHEKYPQLRVHVIASNEISKKTERVMDILLRPVKDLEDYTKDWHISYHHALFANPKYLRKAGTPQNPEDLVGHCILGYGEHEFTYFEDVNWHLKGRKYGLPKVKATLTVNSTKSIFLAALEGIGICSAPIESNTLYSTNLVRVLPQIQGPRVDTYFCMKKSASDIKKKNMNIFNNFIKNYLNRKKVEIIETQHSSEAA